MLWFYSLFSYGSEKNRGIEVKQLEKNVDVNIDEDK